MQRRWSLHRRWQRQEELMEELLRPHLLVNQTGSVPGCPCPGYHLWMVPSYQEKYFRWLEVMPPIFLALCWAHILWLKPSLASMFLSRVYSIITPLPPYVANSTRFEKSYEAIYTLEISSDGPANEHIDYLMGKYTRIDTVKVNDRPVWISRGWTFSTVFYFSRFNKWMVKALNGPWFLRDWKGFVETASRKYSGEMKSRKNGLDEMPEHGWLYWNGEHWKFDPYLRVTAEKEFDQIGQLTITSTGRASIVQDSLMGRYFRLPHTTMRERPVWIHENAHNFLYFDAKYWVIGPDYNRNYSWGVRSTIQCPGCVQTLPEFGWYFWDGAQRSMVKDPTMKVFAHI